MDDTELLNSIIATLGVRTQQTCTRENVHAIVIQAIDQIAGMDAEIRDLSRLLAVNLLRRAK